MIDQSTIWHDTNQHNIITHSIEQSTELGKTVGRIILFLDDDKAGLAAVIRLCTKVTLKFVDHISFLLIYKHAIICIHLHHTTHTLVNTLLNIFTSMYALSHKHTHTHTHKHYSTHTHTYTYTQHTDTWTHILTQVIPMGLAHPVDIRIASLRGKDINKYSSVHLHREYNIEECHYSIAHSLE